MLSADPTKTPGPAGSASQKQSQQAALWRVMPLSLAAHGGAGSGKLELQRRRQAMAFALNSPAFVDGHAMPRRHVRDGGNLSPPLEWHDPPPNTKSFALVIEDPDAPRGTFRHWALYNIPPERRTLPEGLRKEAAVQWQAGSNDFGHTQYDGPQPPPGHGRHRYHFRLVALDVPKLNLPEGAPADMVLRAARVHSVGEAELVGTYEATERRA
jgi:hypothetical protein